MEKLNKAKNKIKTQIADKQQDFISPNVDLENSSIENSSIGDLLKTSREALGVTIQNVSHYLRVRASDIKLLENNDIEKIAKNIYVFGLIKSYGNYLKINPQLIEEKLRDLSLRSNVDVKKHTLLNIGKHAELSPSKDLFINSLIISIILLLFFIILFSALENKAYLVNTNIIVEDILKINN